MKVIKTNLKGCYVIELEPHIDSRGYFVETYNKKVLEEYGINNDFVQDNRSLSREKGTLRGIHFQREPMAQAKLVSCIQGSVFDVAVDLREDSETFGKYFAIELTPENNKMLLIPRGFGHAFQTLTEDTIFQYKVDNFYSKLDEGSIIYNDPDINVLWPIANPILSDKDKIAPTLRKALIK
jgi:dTDP-4-dehydrorhamnose 3,5-epimerase